MTPLKWIDTAGVAGAVLAALCCMGASVIVGALAAVGLSWLRQDALLWPLMFASLAIAFWGLWSDRRRHGSIGPLVLAAAGGASLVAGVVFVHGFPARELIYLGSIALIGATVWNIRLRTGPRRVARTGSPAS